VNFHTLSSHSQKKVQVASPYSRIPWCSTPHPMVWHNLTKTAQKYDDHGSNLALLS
jgi:hypothetical protein